MSVHKESIGTWRVIYRYTDWADDKKQTSKRNIETVLGDDELKIQKEKSQDKR